MKLPIALAAVFLTATTALPAFAHAPTGHSFYAHGGVAQYTRERATGPIQSQPAYSGGHNSYASAPSARRPVVNGWEHCAYGGPGELMSAYPSWNMCP